MVGGGEKGLCIEPRCKNRKGKEHARCYKHMMRRWRKANPMMDAYMRLRESARKRRIEFTISFEEFTDFALQCEYLELKGNAATSLTVDRIKNRIGYVAGNIQPMTRAQNTIKQAKRDEHRLRAGYSWKARQKRK